MPSSNPLPRLGAVIRDRRAKLGMTQRELASRSKLHVNYVCGIERGTRNPTVLALQGIAAGLDTSVWKLLRQVDV